jgi:hypothetical protein
MASGIVFPSQLYRYRSFDTEYALEEISNAVSGQKLFLSSGIGLNDPFDFSPVYVGSELKEVLEDLKRTHGSRRIFSRNRMSELSGRRLTRSEYRKTTQHAKANVLNARLEIKLNGNAVRDLKHKARLACFSELNDSIPMWAHYSANHTGFCIWYDVLPIQRDEELFPLKVEYGKDRPRLSTLDLRLFMNRSEAKNSSDGHQMKVFSAMYLHKSSHWEYEQEWRVFDSCDAPPRYRFVPCLKVAAIAFGIMASKKNIEEVQRIVDQKVQLLNASQSADRFSLDFSRVV